MVIETYYRKRSKKAHQPINSEMKCYQKEAEPLAEQGSINDDGRSLVLGRHHLVPPLHTSDHCTLLLKGGEGHEDEMQNHIKVGDLYEIDHIHLPPKTPVQLRSVRVAMVCEKTELNVAVRFPSMESLRAFFSYSKRETHPALDEKYVMGIALAGKVLFRIVPTEKFSEQKSFEDFWLISSSIDSFRENVSDTQNGDCLSELKCNGMVRWGIRRQVKYLGRHKNDGNNDNGNNITAQNSSSSCVNGVEESHMKLGGDDQRELEEKGNEESDDDVINDVEKVKAEKEDMEENEGEEEEQEDEDNGEDEEEEEEKNRETNWNLKRKRYTFRNISSKKPKKEKLETKKRKQIQKKNQSKRNKNKIRLKEANVLRNPKDRWSADRYKLAEQNLLEVMKGKEAMAEKPILRPQLRAEARKKIGDTGLLDHLLKHMAGKLAPGGKERFRRRHNADGAMEYWLESADLVNVRRDAGITDPYWVPPPGWKPGDSPTQDPICARELKLLQDDIYKIKRDVELMATKMQLEEQVEKLRRELNELSSKRRHEENQANALTSNRSGISQDLDRLSISLVSPKCDLDKTSASMEKYKEQLMVISDFVKEIEKKIGRLLTSNEEERARVDSALMIPTKSTSEKEKKQQPMEPKSKQQEVQEIIMEGEERSDFGKVQNKGQNEAAPKKAEVMISAGSPGAEEKAAKIQRLKSGFRICKPQGTFLWPNMVKNNSINSSANNMMSPPVVVQVEVPTPPSVSSSTASAPPQLPYHHNHQRHPSPPVKPLAERRAVTISVSSVSKDPNYGDGANTYSTTSLINLNDAPSNIKDVMPLMQLPPTNTTPWDGAVYGPSNGIGYDQKQHNICCSSSASSLPSEVGNWLALSTLKSASDESGHG